VSHLGEFEQLILFSVLNLGDGAYGVAIREDIEARTGRVVSSGAIYTALGRLEERGFVSSRAPARAPEGSSDAGPGPGTRTGTGRPGRPRKYYALQPAGARALRATYAAVQAMAGGLIPKLTELAER